MSARQRRKSVVGNRKSPKFAVATRRGRPKRKRKPDLHLRNYLLENHLELGC